MNEREVEYLIQCGMIGMHHLFDNDLIREAFSTDIEELTRVSKSRVDEVSKSLARIMESKSLDNAKEVIFNCPRDIQKVLVMIYFKLIEQNHLMLDYTVH